jgi:hypothetical protein
MLHRLSTAIRSGVRRRKLRAVLVGGAAAPTRCCSAQQRGLPII